MTYRRVYGYVRVSTEEQAESGHSLDAQDKYISIWCRDEGWSRPTIFREEGLSGSDMNRPQLQRLLTTVKTGDLVLLYHNDRLSRETEDILRMVRQFKEKGVVVKFGNLGDVDILTPEGEIMLTMMAAFSKYFLADMKRKQRAGIEQAHDEGIKFGRPLKFFEVHLEDGQRVMEPGSELRTIFMERQAGASYVDIAASHSTNRVQIRRALTHLERWRSRSGPWLLSTKGMQ